MKGQVKALYTAFAFTLLVAILISGVPAPALAELRVTAQYENKVAFLRETLIAAQNDEAAKSARENEAVARDKYETALAALKEICS